jgi:hypothetical protein
MINYTTIKNRHYNHPDYNQPFYFNFHLNYDTMKFVEGPRPDNIAEDAFEKDWQFPNDEVSDAL